MVRQRVVTAEQLRSIDGIGEARVAKYAAQFLPLLQQAFSAAASAAAGTIANTAHSAPASTFAGGPAA